MTYHVTGIILKREHWREAARLYTIYTRESGKVLAVGQGTRKPVSKLAAHLEPFSVSELHLAHGRRMETICGAILKRSPEPIARDGRNYAAAGFVAEAVDHFVKQGERDERLWSLIDAFFEGLAEHPDVAPSRLGGFVWRFMDRLGYRPKLDACAACEGTLGFGGLFLPVKGVALCRNCRPHEQQLVGAELLDARTYAGLRDFFEDEEAVEAAHRPALTFLEAHLDRPLLSLPIVREALNFQVERHTVPAF